METLTFKIGEKLAKEINSLLAEEHYATKTEFIREAIRDKIETKKRNKLIMKYYGASKRKTTDKQLHIAGEKAARDFAKKFNVNLD